MANGISDQAAREGWNKVPWNRFLSYDPTVGSKTPAEAGYPTAALFVNPGHLYLRSAWGDPDATWAFFGAGPKFAGHSRDDEGQFLIAKQGWLAPRVGGQGHNDGDYYAGGSLAFNLVTIFDPDEQPRRTDPHLPAAEGVKNENDGGLIRYVYSRHSRDDRAWIKAFHHQEGRFTYAAGDISTGYSPDKAREVTRQFLYLRGEREFFVIFDRVKATEDRFARHWFLHLPTEPQVEGRGQTLVDGHVTSYDSFGQVSWLSDPAGEEGVLSTGRARAFLRTLLPKQATLTARGGEGHTHWGHPDNPEAQYNHVIDRSLRPPHVPWRLEVRDRSGGAEGFFLHVLELGAESDAKMSPVELVEREGQVGAKLTADGGMVEVLFNREGPLTASLRLADGETRLLEANVNLDK